MCLLCRVSGICFPPDRIHRRDRPRPLVLQKMIPVHSRSPPGTIRKAQAILIDHRSVQHHIRGTGRHCGDLFRGCRCLVDIERAPGCPLDNRNLAGTRCHCNCRVDKRSQAHKLHNRPGSCHMLLSGMFHVGRASQIQTWNRWDKNGHGHRDYSPRSLLQSRTSNQQHIPCNLPARRHLAHPCRCHEGKGVLQAWLQGRKSLLSTHELTVLASPPSQPRRTILQGNDVTRPGMISCCFPPNHKNTQRRKCHSFAVLDPNKSLCRMAGANPCLHLGNENLRGKSCTKDSSTRVHLPSNDRQLQTTLHSQWLHALSTCLDSIFQAL